MNSIAVTAEFRRSLRKELPNASPELLEIAEKVATFDEKLFQNDPLYQRIIVFAKVMIQEMKAC